MILLCMIKTNVSRSRHYHVYRMHIKFLGPYQSKGWQFMLETLDRGVGGKTTRVGVNYCNIIEL